MGGVFGLQSKLFITNNSITRKGGETIFTVSMFRNWKEKAKNKHLDEYFPLKRISSSGTVGRERIFKMAEKAFGYLQIILLV